MSIKIQKRGGVVHNAHRDGYGDLVSNCGSGERYAMGSLRQMNKWIELPESTETTCKKCRKQADEAERLGLHLTVAKNENGSSRVVDTRNEIDETAVVNEPSAFEDAPPVRTYSDGSQTYGPYVTDATEQPDRASYYSGTVPCFERTTVDGIGYGCVNLGEHVEHNTALGAAWWTPTECVAITKYSAHEAFATAVFNGESVGSRITKVRGRWALQYGSGHVIRAKTLGKVAKLWAKALGFHATAIDIDVMN